MHPWQKGSVPTAPPHRLKSPGGFHRGQDDLEAQVDQVDIGHGNHHFPKEHGALIENAVQGLAQGHILVLRERGFRQHGFRVWFYQLPLGLRVRPGNHLRDQGGSAAAGLPMK